MNYSATGKYYKSGTLKYWTAAYGANIIVKSDPALYYYQIDNIYKLTNKCVYPSTTKSYLQMDYNYTVGCYFGIKDIGGVKISSTNVSGYTRFGTSYIP